METVIHFFFQGSLMNRYSKKQHSFEIEIICNLKNVLTVTFDQFNGSLLNKSVKGIVHQKMLNIKEDILKNQTVDGPHWLP